MSYPNLGNLKDYLVIALDNEADDATLTDILVNAIGFVEIYTDRVFVVAADSSEDFDVAAPNVHKDTLFFFRDLAAITSVTNGNGDLIAASDYTTKKSEVSATIYALKLTRKAILSGAYWRYGSDGTAIKIVGKWGYSADCPDTIYEIILRLASLDYRARSAGQGGAVTALSKRAGLVIGAADVPKDIMFKLERFRR